VAAAAVVVLAGVAAVTGAKLPAILPTVPRTAFTLRDFTLLLAGDPDELAAAGGGAGSKYAAGVLAAAPVRKCLATTLTNLTDSIYSDVAAAADDGAPGEFLANTLLERHPQLFAYATCLVASGAAPASALAAYGPQLLLTAVSGMGLTPAVPALLAAVVAAAPATLHVTMESVGTPAATRPPPGGYTLLHSVFDQNKIVFRDAVNSILRANDTATYLRKLAGIAEAVAVGLPPDTPHRPAAAARVRSALTALTENAHVRIPVPPGVPASAGSRRALLARHIYTLNDGLAALLIDVLTAPLAAPGLHAPAAAANATCARLVELATVGACRDAVGRTPFHTASLTATTSLALLAARVQGAVDRLTAAGAACAPTAAAAAATLSASAAATDLFGYTPADMATATLADDALVMPGSLPALSALAELGRQVAPALAAPPVGGDAAAAMVPVAVAAGDKASGSVPVLVPVPALGRPYRRATGDVRTASSSSAGAATPPRTAVGWHAPLRLSPLAVEALAADAAHAPFTHCDVDTLDVDALPGNTSEARHAELAVRFLLDYFIPARPVRIRNYHGIDDIVPGWDMLPFLAAHGEARLEFSHIPYGLVFRHAGGRATIAQFTAAMLWCTADGVLALPSSASHPFVATLFRLPSTRVYVDGPAEARDAAGRTLCAAFADTPVPGSPPTSSAGATAATRNYIFTRLRAHSSRPVAALMDAMQLTPDFLSVTLPWLRPRVLPSPSAIPAPPSSPALPSPPPDSAAADGDKAEDVDDDSDAAAATAAPLPPRAPPRIIAGVGIPPGTAPRSLSSFTTTQQPDGHDHGNHADSDDDSSELVIDSRPLVSTWPKLHDPQFFLGVAGTGAPVHYHHDAVNFCVAGRKRWCVVLSYDVCGSFATPPCHHHLIPPPQPMQVPAAGSAHRVLHGVHCGVRGARAAAPAAGARAAHLRAGGGRRHVCAARVGPRRAEPGHHGGLRPRVPHPVAVLNNYVFVCALIVYSCHVHIGDHLQFKGARLAGARNRTRHATSPAPAPATWAVCSLRDRQRACVGQHAARRGT